jgi:alpha-L-rhamnosidase
MSRKALIVVGFLATLLCPNGFPAMAIEPTHEICERAVDPLGVTAEHPRLGWISTNPDLNDRAQTQSAYQILAATDPTLLAADKSDLWNSGKVDSDQSLDVAYNGKRLTSGQRCFWKVRVWDRDGKPSGWSSPATWSLGVMDPAEWAGQWIGAGDPASRWGDYTVDVAFVLRKEAASIYFRAHGPGDSYMWQINNTGPVPTFRPHLRVNGNYHELKRVPLDRWVKTGDFGTPHRLTIAIKGAEITTSLDGKVIDTATDHQYAGGSIGFRESPTEQAIFQTIRVTDPSGKLLYSQNFSNSNSGSFSGGKPTKDGLVVNNGDAMLESALRTPRLRREFSVGKPVSRAWIYASALGIYELRLNGNQVGDQYFSPGWTNYKKRIEYQTYDVTKLLRQGGNAIAAQLAPGWYAGNIGWFGPNQYGSEPRLFAELHIDYTDGSTAIIASDLNWKASSGPVVSADFQDGETCDNRLEQPGWDQPGFDDRSWLPVDQYGRQESTRLVSQIDPPMRVTREWKPVEVTEPAAGVYVYRLPQNITGVCRVKVRGSPGTQVVIRHAEAVNADGTLNLITLNSPGIANARAHNIDTYIFGNEGEALYQPRFTWRGFQYVEVRGTTGKPSLDDVTGLSIGTDVPLIGELNTSSGLINRINENMHWSGRDAFMSIPMDCPQRSERLGWAGDANFYLATAVFDFDMSRFYAKWEDDLIDSQSSSGLLCHVAPGGWAGTSSEGGYGGGWGDVAVCIPYQMWKTYGDMRPMRDHYDAMARWIDYLVKLSPSLILPADMAAAGDWQNRSDRTPNELCATAYFAYDVKLLSEMASALGKTADVRKYQELFKKVRDAFAGKFISTDGRVGSESQTSYVLALHIGLVPEGLRNAAAVKLVENVARHGNKLTTGFVGTQWLLPVLTNIGRSDLAYAVLEQTSEPSWGYMVKHGSTTIWENWAVVKDDGTINTGPNSLNHCALGSCGDWLYENIGGIRLDPDAVAFKNIIIQPRPGGGVTHAQATYQTPYGQLEARWHIDGRKFILKLTIPVGTKAKVVIPACESSKVTESGVSADTSRGVQLMIASKGSATYQVGSGVYSFASEMP